MTSVSPIPPKHLSKDRKRFWSQVITEASFEFEAHHLAQLALLCDALDRAEQARDRLAAEGLTVTDARGRLIAHPLVAVERESQRTALRAMTALKLDDVLDAPKPGLKVASGVYR